MPAFTSPSYTHELHTHFHSPLSSVTLTTIIPFPFLSIADRGGDQVSPKEWDRICFDLLELLKAHKKGIRRAAVNTFGYIARAIGPFDVLLTLLNNLKVQERQLRVCTTVAIAIVAETCQPYTVLPALMNEYRCVRRVGGCELIDGHTERQCCQRSDCFLVK